MSKDGEHKKERLRMIAQNLRNRGARRRREPYGADSGPRIQGEQIAPLHLARMRAGLIPYPDFVTGVAGSAPPEDVQAQALVVEAGGEQEAAATTPAVTPRHRGSGRWSLEVDGVPLKEAGTGEVALFDSRESAETAGASYLAAIEAGEDRGD